MNKVLEIENLTKKFGNFTAVNDISFSVEKGNVYGLLGPNGSGKSTTLGIILNIINSNSGKWRWFGEEPGQESLKRIGAIIENPKFYPYLSAQKNLEIVANIKAVSYQKIDEKLELVGLLDRKKDLFQHYSLGMKQRLAIAGALLNDPEVLILDEPTNGLDPQGITQIRELIIEIANRGTTIILASHLLDEVEKVCSHVVVLNKGKMLYSGAVEAMTSSHGSVEIAAPGMDILKIVLNNFHFVSSVKLENNKYIAVLKEDKDPAEINEILFKQGIIVNHLVKRKESLEKQFFQLIQNQKN